MNSLSKRILALFVTASAAIMSLSSAEESAAQRDTRMGWWREARFGMFIHWGVYAVPAGEWEGKTNYGEWFLEETKIPVSRYEKFAGEFNPVKFNADEWVRLAKDAGMKYVVITTKHHDGFGLWPSALTDWNIKATPFGRDPLKELAQACQKAGIRLCFYYSIMDWHHPDWELRRAWNDKTPGTLPNMDRYVQYMKGQLKELIESYGPIGILWFDGEWESVWNNERGADLEAYLRKLQPDLIINNRIGKGRAGMQGMNQGQGLGDYGTPEQEIPPTGFGPGIDWESCMTMNDHWGYNKHDQNYKSTTTLLRNLIDIASKGGNYLLNVGPTAEGVIPEPQADRLKELGAWLKVNGEAIHGTTAGLFAKPPAWGRMTCRPGKIYLHVFDWPADGKLLLPIPNKVTSARLLAAPGQRVEIATVADGVEFHLPSSAPDPIASVIALNVEGQVATIAPLASQAADGPQK